MIPLTFLYDEYIDRPKLSEQKNPFEYIVSPPSGVGTIKFPWFRRATLKKNTCFYYPENLAVSMLEFVIFMLLTNDNEV